MKIFFIGISLLIVFNLNLSYPCTTFCIHTEDELVFGRNYDWSIGNGIVFVNKKELVKTAFTKTNKPAEWVSKYGSVTFNQYGREFPTGGMNEAGLVVELMWLDETKYPAQDERPATGGVLQWIQYQLDNSQTVQDVIDSDSKIRIPVQAVPIHFLIADKNGNTASIEFLNGKLAYHTGESMPYTVLTNDSYERSLEYLKEQRDFGGTMNLSPEKGSLERFAMACSFIKNYKKESGRSAVDYGFNILNSVSQGESTKWSIIYDIKNMKIYFKTFDSPKTKNIDLSLFDFKCSTPVQMFDINSDIEGNINSSMINYTYEANRKLIEDSYNGVDFLKSASDKEKDLTAGYPDKLNCRSKSFNERNDIDNSQGATVLILSGIIFLSVALMVGYKIKKPKKK